MDMLSDLWRVTFLGNSLLSWGIAIGVSTLALLALLTIRRVIRSAHRRMAAAKERDLPLLALKVLSRTTVPFLVIAALFSGIMTLDLSPRALQVLWSIITIAAFWQVGVWSTAAVASWVENRHSASRGADRAAVGSMAIIGFVIRVLVWGLVVLLTLDNLGVNITALVAGLGIGGVAIALAVQNVLGDVLASLSITLDKPFVVGDFLIVEEYLGSVEYIGVKSTRLRSLTGEQIVMSNADLLSSRVRNYGRMYERRVVFALGITYETPRAKFVQIPALLRAIIEEHEGTRFDRSHFAKYGDFSLDFETVFYVLSADYNRYMDIQQKVNVRIHEEFERLGIEFAYPTQKLWLQRVDAPRPRPLDRSQAQPAHAQVRSA